MAPNYLPLLQIVHITDLHVVAPSARTFASRYRVAMRYLPQRIRDKIEGSSAPHDRNALQKFAEFLPRVVREGEGWDETPVWIIDTGDLTGYGDRGSLQEGDI